MATAPAKVHTIRPPKRRKNKAGQNRTKPHGMKTPKGKDYRHAYSYLPYEKRKEIISEWVIGETSMTQMAIKHGIDISAVKTIVEGPEARQALEITGKILASEAAEVIAPLLTKRVVRELKDMNSKMGAIIAWDAFERLGGIPARINKSQVQKTDKDVEQSAVKKVLAGEGEERISKLSLALTTLAMQGRRAYGLPLPDMEALDAEVVAREDGPAKMDAEELEEIEMAIHRERDE